MSPPVEDEDLLVLRPNTDSAPNDSRVLAIDLVDGEVNTNTVSEKLDSPSDEWDTVLQI